MAKFSGEELDWLNKLGKTNQLRKVDPNLKGVQLADKLEGSAAHASYMLSLSDCLDQAAIDKVRQAAKDNPPFILSFNSARALIRLNGRVDNLPASVHDALDVIFSRRLPTEQIKALVVWMLKGNRPETFNESETGKKKNHVRSSLEKGLVQGVDPTPTSPSDLKKVLELSEKLKAQLARGDSRPAALGELKALLAGTTAETQEDEDSNKKEEK
ncbi:MAG TPA: hypothetical protein VN963_03015, partial [bacterium]|nr:hypothetical protein [bacterium]